MANTQTEGDVTLSGSTTGGGIPPQDENSENFPVVMRDRDSNRSLSIPRADFKRLLDMIPVEASGLKDVVEGWFLSLPPT